MQLSNAFFFVSVSNSWPIVYLKQLLKSELPPIFPFINSSYNAAFLERQQLNIQKYQRYVPQIPFPSVDSNRVLKIQQWVQL
jgi:hypothetical protein